MQTPLFIVPFLILCPIEWNLYSFTKYPGYVLIVLKGRLARSLSCVFMILFEGLFTYIKHSDMVNISMGIYIYIYEE